VFAVRVRHLDLVDERVQAHDGPGRRIDVAVVRDLEVDVDAPAVVVEVSGAPQRARTLARQRMCAAATGAPVHGERHVGDGIVVHATAAGMTTTSPSATWVHSTAMSHGSPSAEPSNSPHASPSGTAPAGAGSGSHTSTVAAGSGSGVSGLPNNEKSEQPASRSAGNERIGPW
jgi:hypothetical protein